MRRAEKFQRKHDTYSLGCVLLEIGTWKGLEAFSWSSKYEKDQGKWHARLMQEMGKLRAMCGRRYAESVRACLEYGAQIDALDGNDVRGDVQALAFDVLLRLEEVVV